MYGFVLVLYLILKYVTPAEGVPHSSRSHTKWILLYVRPILGQLKELSYILFFPICNVPT